MNTNNIYPLTAAQESIFFDQSIKPDNPCYNIGCSINLDRVDIDFLQATLNEFVVAFDVLGADFYFQGQELVQQFHVHETFPVVIKDFSLFQNAEEALEKDMREQFNKVFELGSERLIESCLYRVSEGKYTWLLRMHHIVSDALGILIWVNQLKQVLANKTSQFSAAVGNFRDVIIAEQNYLRSNKYEQDKKYWQDKFVTLPKPLLLPIHRKEFGVSSTLSHRITFELTDSLRQSLSSQAKQIGGEINQLFLAALVLYFSRIEQRNDIVISTPVHRRRTVLQRNTVGMFTADLPGLFDLSDSNNFAGLLGAITKEQRRNLRHQSYPMHHLGRVLNLTGQGREVISEVIFNYVPLYTDLVSMASNAERDPLHVRVTDYGTNQPLVLDVYCRDEYLNSEEATQFGKRYIYILEQLSALSAESTLNDIQVVTPDERVQLLHDFNDTKAPEFLQQAWPELFVTQVAKTPDAIAVQQGNRVLTYRELDKLSNRLARALREKNIGAGCLVGLLDHRDLDLLVMFIAVIKSGAAWIPFDPGHPTQRWLDVLNESNPDLLLVGSLLSLESRMLSRKWQSEKISRFDQLIEKCGDDTALEGFPDLNDLAYVLFTSGSTGKPKGVMIEHLGMINNMLAKFKPLTLTSDDVIAQTASQCFDISVWQNLTALLLGARVDIVPEEICRDPEALLQYLNTQKITVWEPVPSMIHAALAYDQPLPTLRWVLPTGEALTPTLVSKWFQHYESIPLMNAYGPAECADDVAFQPITQPVERVLIGKPVANVRLHIFDSNRSLLPVGVIGELAVSGPIVGRGYLHLPEQTQAVFLTNPYAQDEQDKRLYLTGDLARRMPDGTIEYIGRKDHQLKVRGYRIEPAEIETQLLTHPDVHEAVIDAKKDKQGQLQLVAYVVSDQNVHRNTETTKLREFLKARVPTYMVPQAIVLIEKIPLTANGKIDRFALPDPVFEDVTEFVAPQTATQEKLVQIWQQILGLHSISTNANFFDIGGHSLLASRMLSLIRDLWRIELSIKTIFETRNLAELAEKIDKAGTAELPVIEKVSDGQALPLSFAQQRLWFIDQLVHQATEYNMAGAFRLEGELNVVALERALNSIIMRHQVLRTIYREIDGRVQQSYLDALNFQLHQQDLTQTIFTQVDKSVESILLEKIQEPFDLSNDLMLRATLLKTGVKEHVLLIVIHHIASDGWSKYLLVSELSQLYSAFLVGHTDPLPTLDIQYSDYAHWQRNWLSKARIQQQLQFWREHLKDLPPVHSLPLDRPRPAVQSHNGNMLKVSLEADQAAAVLQLAKNQNVTLFMLLNAALATLIHRYSGETDIVIGTPVANRDQPQVAPLVGFFVNTLLIRSDASNNPSFRDFLLQTKERALDAFTHSQLPFDVLVEALQPERSLAYNPLFQIMLAVQNNTEGTFTLPKIDVTEFSLTNQKSQFDLSVEVTQSAHSLSFSWTWATDLFDEPSISLMANQMLQLLISTAQNPNQLINEIALLNEAERKTSLANWRAHLTDFSSVECLQQRFERQALERPDAIAVTFENQQLSYAELNGKANQLAHYLIELGVGAEVLVGLSVERCPKMLVGILAILKAGGAYLPLDPAYPEFRLTHMLQDSACKFILTQSHLIEKLPLRDQIVIEMDDEALTSNYSSKNPDCRSEADSLAYVIYTSGSTGKPKGVMVEHRHVVRLFDASFEDFNFTHEDVWTLFHSYAFDFSVWEIWGAFFYGGRLVIVPHWVARSTSDFYQLLQHQKVTVLNQTPTAFGHLIGVDSELQQSLHLRRVIFGGEALNLQSLLPWVMRHGEEQPHLINMYGITETTVHVTYRRITKHDILQSGNVSLIGKPLRDLALYLLTPSLDIAPIGIPGEMYVSGAGVTRGYLNREELTNERFIENPFVKGELLYRTGDLARYRNDGDLEYIGRCDQQVKIRGFRIELGEIESSILSLPGVTEAVVVARDEPKRLVAYLVKSKANNESADLQISNIRESLLQRLPEYMIPAAFVLLDKLPVTANGKTDRNALPTPDIEEQLEGNYVAPDSPLEETLCEVWQSHLQIERIGTHDNFFRLGGDSIRAISVVAASKKVGLNYSIKDLFTYPTVHSLAQAIKNILTDTKTQQVISAFSLLNELEKSWLEAHTNVANIVDAYPQSMLQQGMLLHSQLGSEIGVYHDVFGSQLRGQWKSELFRQALTLLVAEQDSLRAIFHNESARPLVIVFKEIELPFEVNDLTHLNANQQAEHIASRTEREKISTFDFSKPVWRIIVDQLADDQFYYQLYFHHALLDGWSVASLNSKLFDLYARLLKQESLPSPQKALSYSQFVALEQQALHSTEQQTYWQRKMAGAQLPWWAATEQTTSRTLNYELSEQHDLKLQALAKQFKVQEKSVLLAIHMSLLALISGNADVTTSVVTNGRPEMLGSEKSLGLFLNSLPLRIENVQQSWRQLICELNDELTSMMAYRRYPIAALEVATGMEYSASLFNYIDFHIYKGMGDALEVLKVDDFEQTNYLFDANYSRNPLNNSLSIEINLDAACFDDDFVTRIHGYIDNIIHAMVDNAEAIVDAGAHLGAEAQVALKTWNNTATPEFLTHSWPELFATQVAKTPDAIAVQQGNRVLTYRELDKLSNRLARALREKNIGAGCLVGLLDHRDLDLLVMFIAVIKSGAAWIPFDPGHPAQRWLDVLNESNPDLLLVGNLLSVESGMLSHKWQSEKITRFDQLIEKCGDDTALEGFPDLNDLAYVLFTSGSTGKPKGVMIEHLGMINNMLAKFKPLTLTSDDVIAQTASQCFDISVWQNLTALLLGARVDIVPEEICRDPEALLQYLNTQKITVWEPVPSVIKAALDYRIDLPHLRWVLPTGEALQSSLVAAWFGKYPQIPLMNAYGPAECSDDVAFQKLTEPVERVLIGKPVANARLHVVTPELTLVPTGVVGELAISGPVVGRGYLGQIDKTNAVFINNPWPQDEHDTRMYLTGDLVKRHKDGSLEYVGRKDFQVKVRGYRIELGEIESKLHVHPLVSDAVVVTRPAGDGDHQLVAYVVGSDAHDKQNNALVIALKDYLRSHLPHYMVPSFIVTLPNLPLSANGKLDRNALPAPELSVLSNYEAPDTETEQMLAGIWQSLLGKEKISRHDNFFDIGGHSLLATRMISMLREQWQLEISLNSVFDANSLADQARSLDDLQLLKQLDDNVDLDSLSESELDRYLALLAAEELEA